MHSLMVEPMDDDIKCESYVEEIHVTIIRYINSAKLRHLKIFIRDMDEVKMLLDKSRNLFSIQFSLWNQSVSSEEITAYVKTLMPGCLISCDNCPVSIWMDRRVEATHGSESLQASQWSFFPSFFLLFLGCPFSSSFPHSIPFFHSFMFFLAKPSEFLHGFALTVSAIL
jgi:hypothetical protein